MTRQSVHEKCKRCRNQHHRVKDAINGLNAATERPGDTDLPLLSNVDIGKLSINNLISIGRSRRRRDRS